MSFLAPLFFLGALAIGLPILFHLIRRSTREKVAFSSLMFLTPSPPRVTKRSRLEDILLLLLRALAVVLLVLAFARPYLQRPVKAAPAPEGQRRVLALVDTSASMKRQGLWEAARAKAVEVARRAAPGDEMAIYTFDRTLRKVATFEDWTKLDPGERAGVVGSRLGNITPGWAGTDLGNALMNASELLEEAGKTSTSASQEIIVISDLQEGSHLETVQGYNWPKDLRITVEQLRAQNKVNAGVQLLPESETSAVTNAAGAIRVRVYNSAQSDKEQFRLQWKGTNDSAAPPVDVYVPPGQSRVVALQKPANGSEQLTLSGDAEPFDNTLHVAGTRAVEIKVLFFGSDRVDDPAGLYFYLGRAFQQTREREVQLLPPVAGNTTNDLRDFTLAIGSGNIPQEQLSTLQGSITNGKVFMYVCRDAAASGVLSTLFGRQTTVEEGPAKNYHLLTQIDFEHPIFAPFSDPRFSDFTRMHFWKYRRIDADAIPNARVIARFDSGDPAIVHVPFGRGAVLLLASGWQPADSQLALSTKFVPLLYSVLDFSGAPKAQAGQYLAGDPVPIPESLLRGNTPVTFRLPDGSTVKNQSASFTQTDTPGIYIGQSGDNTWKFSVNLSPTESRTAPLPSDAFYALGAPLKVDAKSAKLTEAATRQLQGMELEKQQKLWRWLIAAALLILVTETWLGGWLAQRKIAPATA